MTASQNPPSARALQAFRRRVDAFFGDARAADFAAALAPSAVGAPATTEDALAAPLGLTLARLGAEPADDGLRLRKSLTLHDGRVVSMTGDATPLGAAEDVRIVTTTTTVLDAERLRVETNVLVFEREGSVMTLLDAEHGFLEVEPHDPAARRADREVVLLLHGLGGNKADWSFPAWRSYHWEFDGVPAERESDNHLLPPLNPWDHLPEFSLSDLRTDVRCWSGVLTALGHTVINYSQDGPQQQVEVPLEQLEERIVPFLREQVLVGPLAGKRVVVLCHSRGGILVRAYIRRHAQEASEWIGRVITMCSPHQGTLAPNARQRLVDAASAIGLLPFGPMVSAVTRITGWLDESPGAQQLLPDDPVFAELALPAEVPEIDFTTFGGTSVRYTRLYSWHFTPDSYIPGGFPDIRFDWTLFPVEIPIASPALECLPDLVVDDEQDEGEGDGLVADERARLPGAPHHSLPINHAEALWDEALFARVADLLGTPLNGDEAVECVRGFIGNRRSLEVHDPSRKRRNCQLDEIVEPWPFKRADEAFDAGYDGCAYCMPDHHTR